MLKFESPAAAQPVAKENTKSLQALKYIQKLKAHRALGKVLPGTEQLIPAG